MLARVAHKATLCPGCGHPKDIAWHWDNDGEFDADPATCHACTAAKRRKDQPVDPVEYVRTTYTRDHETDPLPPFEPPTNPESEVSQ